MLLTTDAVGGVWRYTLDLAAGFAECGVALVLVVLGPTPNAVQREEAAAVPGLTLIETDLPLDWTAVDRAALDRAVVALRGLAEETRVDTVHLHAPALIGQGTWPAPVAAVAHSCVGTWWRAVRDGPLPPDLAWRAEATADGLRAADAVIAPSRAQAEALRAVYGVTRSIEVIHNGRTPLRVPEARRARAVLTAGRLWDEAKNAAALDVAAARLDAPVLAAGSVRGPNGATVSLRNLRLLGSLEERELAAQYASVSVFASVARYEPFGLAVLEAAQAGLPLLLSGIGSFRELWGGAAVLVEPDDPAAIAAGLRRLLDDPGDWGERAKARAGRYTAAAMTEATWDVHRGLLAVVAG